MSLSIGSGLVPPTLTYSTTKGYLICHWMVWVIGLVLVPLVPNTARTPGAKNIYLRAKLQCNALGPHKSLFCFRFLLGLPLDGRVDGGFIGFENLKRGETRVAGGI